MTLGASLGLQPMLELDHFIQTTFGFTHDTTIFVVLDYTKDAELDSLLLSELAKVDSLHLALDHKLCSH